MSFSDKLDQDARLRILQALANQTDNRLADRMIVHELDAWGHRRSVDYVRTQLNRLEELRAVTLPTKTDAVTVAEITTAGLDHVNRRGLISGVQRPEPGE